MLPNIKGEREIKRLYLKNSRNKVYVAMEGANFIWSAQEARDFRELWRNGISLTDIAAYFKRTHEEVTILVMDQALKGFVEPREGGIFGNC